MSTAELDMLHLDQRTLPRALPDDAPRAEQGISKAMNEATENAKYIDGNIRIRDLDFLSHLLVTTATPWSIVLGISTVLCGGYLYPHRS